jgi:hypothetical protein
LSADTLKTNLHLLTGIFELINETKEEEEEEEEVVK